METVEIRAKNEVAILRQVLADVFSECNLDCWPLGKLVSNSMTLSRYNYRVFSLRSNQSSDISISVLYCVSPIPRVTRLYK